MKQRPVLYCFRIQTTLTSNAGGLISGGFTVPSAVFHHRLVLVALLSLLLLPFVLLSAWLPGGPSGPLPGSLAASFQLLLLDAPCVWPERLEKQRFCCSKKNCRKTKQTLTQPIGSDKRYPPYFSATMQRAC